MANELHLSAERATDLANKFDHLRELFEYLLQGISTIVAIDDREVSASAIAVMANLSEIANDFIPQADLKYDLSPSKDKSIVSIRLALIRHGFPEHVRRAAIAVLEQDGEPPTALPNPSISPEQDVRCEVRNGHTIPADLQEKLRVLGIPQASFDDPHEIRGFAMTEVLGTLNDVVDNLIDGGIAEMVLRRVIELMGAADQAAILLLNENYPCGDDENSPESTANPHSLSSDMQACVSDIRSSYELLLAYLTSRADIADTNEAAIKLGAHLGEMWDRLGVYDKRPLKIERDSLPENDVDLSDGHEQPGAAE